MMKRTRLWYVPAIFALVLLVPFTAFAGGQQEPEAEAPPATMTILDSIGNEVVVPAEPLRVASLRSGITEIICALGRVDRIVAVDEMTKDGYMYGQFIASVHPELMEQVAPYKGRDVNVEALLNSEPDLVLHGGYGRIRQADAIRELAPDLPVVIAHFETLDAYMDDIRIVGACVNAEEEAEKLISFLEGYLSGLQRNVDAVPAGDVKKVYYCGHDVYHAYGGETFEHYQILRAGGINVAESLSGWMPEVSAEQLLEWNPDLIVMLNGADVSAVLSDNRIEDVAAVKNGNVHALPEAGWDFSTPRALFCMEWIFSLLYPEVYKADIQLRADEFYNAVFGTGYIGPGL